MKRLLTFTLVFALVLALALPAAAFAKKGGVPANGKGHSAAVAPSSDTAPDVKDNGKGKDKIKAAGDELAGEELEGDEPADDVEAPDVEDGDEASDEPTEKLTGIANALSRLQRNLARKQAQFEAGKGGGLPAGLQSTIAKFMSWLGMDPADEVEGDDDESSETSPTVEPEDDPADGSEDLPEDDGALSDTL